MENQNQNTEKPKETAPEGLTAADAHEAPPSTGSDSTSSSGTGSTSSPEGQQTKPPEKTDQAHETEASGNLLSSIWNGDWSALRKQAAKTADAALSYLTPADNLLTGLTVGEAAATAAASAATARAAEALAAKPIDKPATAEAAAPAEQGIVSRTFNFLSDSVSSFFGSEKPKTIEGQFNSGKAPSEASGFSFDGIGETLNGFLNGAVDAAKNTANAILGTNSDFAFSTATGQFNFDGHQRSGSTASTESGGFFSFVSRGIDYVAETYDSVKDNLTDFFWGGDQNTGAASPSDNQRFANNEDLESHIFGRPKAEKTENGVTVTDASGTSVTKNADGTTIQAGDRTVQQTKDGTKVTSDNSTLGARQAPDGSITITDRATDKPLYQFSNAGDAQRFFENGGVLTTPRPGESVEQAMHRLQTEKGNEGKAIVVTDGQGNVMSVDENGNTLRTRNGVTELSYKKTNADGTSSNVEVRIQGRGEGTVVQVKMGGQYVDINRLSADQQAALRKHLEGTDLSVRSGEDGNRHLWRRNCNHRHHHDERPGAGGTAEQPAAAPPEVQRLVNPDGSVRANDSTTVGPDGVIKTKDDQGTAITVTNTPDQPGGVTITEQRPGEQISRVATIDADRNVTIQGYNPDGTPNQNEVVQYDRQTRTAKLFDDVDGDGKPDIELGPGGVRVGNPDGSHVHLNPNGDFNFYDPDGKLTFDSTTDEAFNEYLAEYEQEQYGYDEYIAEQQAEAAKNYALSVVAALDGMSSYIPPGALAGALSAAHGAAAQLAALGLDVGPIMAAIGRLEGKKDDFANHQALQNQIYARAGTINDTLVKLAFSSGLRGDAAADFAVKRFYGRDGAANA